VTDILFVIPPGLGEMISHHEATSGMGALAPAAGPAGEAGFLYPPHTVAACVAATRAAGASTVVLDGTRSRAPAAFARAVADMPAAVMALLISEGTALADANFLRLLRQVRREDRRVLLFGPSAHFVAAPLLAEGLADAVLTGEPEGAIVEAAGRLAAGRLSGLTPADELRPELYDAGNLLADLDAPPFPAWDAVPWQPYGMVSLLSSRGCPAGCRYCAYVVAQGRHTRTQGAGRTLEEWEWLAREVRPPYLQVRDPVFAADRGRVQALCSGIIARRIEIPWTCESRPEHFGRDLLRLMKAAGCVAVKIGMESGDPGVLRAIGRLEDGQSPDAYLAQVRRVAADCRQVGLLCRVFVMAGLPGQAPDSLARTVAVLRQLAPDATIHAKPYQSHPGTALPGPSASVSPDVLEQLKVANRPGAPLWRRALRRLRAGGGGAGERGSRGAGEQGSKGAEERGRNGAPLPLRPSAPLPLCPSAPPPPDAAGNLSGRRVFLTGGNGFLGGYVARALVGAGAQVVALVRPGSDLGALAELPVEIARGDLTQPSAWLERLRGCELCFHVAAFYGPAAEAGQMYAVNAGATAALMAACASAGVRRVIYTGTIGTVGRLPGAALLDETVPFNLWDQASHYVRSKYLGELIARSWDGAGLEVVVVKPTAPVGAGDGRPSATGRRILAALRGEVTPYPPGGINHVPVQDVAAGHLLAAAAGKAGETYILGHAGGNLDHAAFLRLVAAAGDNLSPLPPSPFDRLRAGSARRGGSLAPPSLAGKGVGGLGAIFKAAPSQLPEALTANPARAIRELGMPQSNLAAAFRDAVAWYRSHGEAARG